MCDDDSPHGSPVCTENLEEASDSARLELGIEVVRAQRTSQALDAMAYEIKRCKRELPWGA